MTFQEIINDLSLAYRDFMGEFEEEFDSMLDSCDDMPDLCIELEEFVQDHEYFSSDDVESGRVALADNHEQLCKLASYFETLFNAWFEE